MQYLLGATSGSLVGFTLGLFGGGGSILAVPLMVYLVGVSAPHVAIGTSACAVAANAAMNLIPHALRGNVIWRCAFMYAGAGVVGATLGAWIGKSVPGQSLLILFALLMAFVGVQMYRGRRAQGTIGATCNREKAPKVLGYGGATGVLSGFFGIGGGFLIVPGLVASTGMPIINAIGSSLVAVLAFGITTALSYAASGLVDWPLAAVFIAGGTLGGLLGARVAATLSRHRGTLATAFSGLILVVALYMLVRSVITLLG